MSGQGLSLSGTCWLLVSEGCIPARETDKKMVKFHPFLGGKWQQPCMGAGTKELSLSAFWPDSQASFPPAQAPGGTRGPIITPTLP